MTGGMENNLHNYFDHEDNSTIIYNDKILEIIQSEKFGFLYNTIIEMSNCMEVAVDIENRSTVNNIIDNAFERGLQLYSQE